VRARIIAFVLFFVLAMASAAMPPVPRKSPEFTIVEPSGKQTLLSSFKGKVVVLAFVHTTCVHCQAFSTVLNKLQKELGPQGFQPVAVAWNEGAQALVDGFVNGFKITFPVGYSTWDPIMSFLGFSVMDRPVVPLVVVIDRKGMIRAESPPQGDPNLQDEAKLRVLIESLLKENSVKPKPRKAS
jgi:thiol-disulfide isomerase/thioredoxin